MSTIFGYEIKDFANMWRLFVHDKEKNPKDLHELINFWECYPKRTPDDFMAITMKMSEAYAKVDISEVCKMVERLLHK